MVEKTVRSTKTNCLSLIESFHMHGAQIGVLLWVSKRNIKHGNADRIRVSVRYPM